MATVSKNQKTASDTKTLKPAKPGAIVRFPGNPSRRLADEGETVKLSAYWRRRLAAGDVEEVKPGEQSSKQRAAKE